MKNKKSYSDKFWLDKRGQVVVWQKPNIWLTTWFVTVVAGWFVPYGWPSSTVGWVSLVALIVWAVLEVAKGVNYFRRLVGLLVLLILILVRI